MERWRGKMQGGSECGNEAVEEQMEKQNWVNEILKGASKM